MKIFVDRADAFASKLAPTLICECPSSMRIRRSSVGASLLAKRPVAATDALCLARSEPFSLHRRPGLPETRSRSKSPNGRNQHKAAASQAIAETMDERWWEVFHDPQLSALTQRALTDNLDLKLASSRLQQSRAARQVITAERYPNTAATGSYGRKRNSGEGLSDPSGQQRRLGVQPVGRRLLRLLGTGFLGPGAARNRSRRRHPGSRGKRPSRRAAVGARRNRPGLHSTARRAEHPRRHRAEPRRRPPQPEAVATAPGRRRRHRPGRRRSRRASRRHRIAPAGAGAAPVATDQRPEPVDGRAAASAARRVIHRRRRCRKPRAKLPSACRRNWPSAARTSARPKRACMPPPPALAWPRAISIRASPCRATSARKPCS